MFGALERGMREVEKVREQRLVEKIRKIVREELKKETEDVYEVRFGDVRKDNYDGVYVVTYFYKGDEPHVDLLYGSGKVVSDCNVKSVKCDKILARHDNWIDAVNSKEFRNE